MRLWTEYNINAFDYFSFFNNNEFNAKSNLIPPMSVFSINADGISSITDKKNFISQCSAQVKELYCSNYKLKKYTIYLFINYKILNPNSKIENYKKAWYQIERKFDISDFKLGNELKLKAGSTYFFSSIAKVPIDKLDIGFSIVSSNPLQYTMFMSKSDDKTDDIYVKKMFSLIGNDKNINYCQLCKECCCNGDIAVRYGTTFEDAEIAFIYNPTSIEICPKYVS